MSMIFLKINNFNLKFNKVLKNPNFNSKMLMTKQKKALKK